MTDTAIITQVTSYSTLVCLHNVKSTHAMLVKGRKACTKIISAINHVRYWSHVLIDESISVSTQC